MYLVLEEAGLILHTKQYEEKQKEKEATATVQSASLLRNNKHNAISMPIIA